MRIELSLYASLRDELGPSFPVDLPDGPEPASVADLRRALAAAHPLFGRFGTRLLVAVNEAYARDGDPVRPGDDVALLPPVAGG